jgi:hypothetical protein
MGAQGLEGLGVENAYGLSIIAFTLLVSPGHTTSSSSALADSLRSSPPDQDRHASPQLSANRVDYEDAADPAGGEASLVLPVMMSSMLRRRDVSEQMKKIQSKYKSDPQTQQQMMAKLYQDNNVRTTFLMWPAGLPDLENPVCALPCRSTRWRAASQL